MDWEKSKVLVTGGCSFIGSHLVDALIARGATVRVIDNLSSGKQENIQAHVKSGQIELVIKDLLEPGVAPAVVKGMDLVFHLAADHGGRGYVDLHQAACATNLTMDGLLFRACVQQNVEKVVFASSGCIYPNYIQNNPTEMLYLTEEKGGPPYDADNLYGWAKLMAEMTLQAYHRDYGLKEGCCRYFTPFGPRGHGHHDGVSVRTRPAVCQKPL